MSDPASPSQSTASKVGSAAKMIIVSSVMFTFISYWRTAAVVLCDLASTSYYIGGIVEQSVGAVAPWFILAVMLFSYAVRSVYIESCTMFVRGGVYRVVREALGTFAAKLAVSALMFDYILTGPISGVSAGQYFVNLILDLIAYFRGSSVDQQVADFCTQWGSVVIACSITLYFFRKNLIGIHESSEKALKIMIATSIMAVIMITWCCVTLVQDGPRNSVLVGVDLSPKPNYSATDPGDPPIVDPTGFLKDTALGEALKKPEGTNWWTLVGLIGIGIAFGQSILAMSGEETLAQVYREIESPKLANFKKAAFIVFVYSLVLTAGISFLAVMIIPNDLRMPKYHDNLIGGLAMSVVGPQEARLLLNAFVVIVGTFLLAGAVNTAIIGSNGVLNRVAEDGVMPEWFLRPHRRYGTTYRILFLILILQLFTIILSRGKTLVLGEAYAFGVVWSFVFMAVSMVVLRIRDKRPREFRVPLNITLGKHEIPLGLLGITFVLILAALANLLTKEIATIGGIAFTGIFFTIFMISETYYQRKRQGKKHHHLEQFNQQAAPAVNAASLNLDKAYRKLVAIRSPQNLFMLEKTLRESDPGTTDVVVMTAKLMPHGDISEPDMMLDIYDKELLTAVVQRAETTGKEVKPLIVPTNNPLYAIARTAKDLNVQEVALGASNKYTADEQFEQFALYWLNLCQGHSTPLTIRLLGHHRDVQYDIAGGNRIPKLSELQAKSSAALRAAGVGVRLVLFVHDGSREASDLFQALLTMLDKAVGADVAEVVPPEDAVARELIDSDLARAGRLGRQPRVHHNLTDKTVARISDLVHDQHYDLVIASRGRESYVEQADHFDPAQLYKYLPCRVMLASPPAIPDEPEQSGSA
jgi:amino acid transporter